jgi:hypothetical protein
MSDTTIPIRRPPAAADASRPKEQPRYPTDTVALPTKGWYYPETSPLTSGDVEIKQMTAREEDIMANQELIRKGTVLDKLLQSMLINKEIDVGELLVPDKNAILMAIRRFAYGDKYPVHITCPNCNHRSRVDIDLSAVQERLVPETGAPRFTNSFPFTLPKSKVSITYKLLNQRDDDKIEKELAGLKKINKEGSGELTTRMKYIITSVNGDDSAETIRNFVDEQLLAADSRALREHIRANTPDLDMSFDFACESCNLERRLDIPVGASFLWPDLET